jgi:ParB-like chromosome segregation protein Spo0J
MLNVQEIEVKRLKPWKGNPRLNEHAVDAVAQSIRSFGFNVPILCDQNMMIVAGHTRWKAAKRLGLRAVPVIQLEMTDVQRRAFAVADNKTGELAGWDYGRLEKVLEELVAAKVELPSLGFAEAELQALLAPPKDFDWAAFEKQMEGLRESAYVLLPVKVLMHEKDRLSSAIRERARRHGIADKDFATAAGKLLSLLLEAES